MTSQQISSGQGEATLVCLPDDYNHKLFSDIERSIHEFSARMSADNETFMLEVAALIEELHPAADKITKLNYISRFYFGLNLGWPRDWHCLHYQSPSELAIRKAECSVESLEDVLVLPGFSHSGLHMPPLSEDLAIYFVEDVVRSTFSRDTIRERQDLYSKELEGFLRLTAGISNRNSPGHGMPDFLSHLLRECKHGTSYDKVKLSERIKHYRFHSVTDYLEHPRTVYKFIDDDFEVLGGISVGMYESYGDIAHDWVSFYLFCRQREACTKITDQRQHGTICDWAWRVILQDISRANTWDGEVRERLVFHSISSFLLWYGSWYERVNHEEVIDYIRGDVPRPHRMTEDRAATREYDGQHFPELERRAQNIESGTQKEPRRIADSLGMNQMLEITAEIHRSISPVIKALGLPEILQWILRSVTFRDIAGCARVNKFWNKNATELLWQGSRNFGSPYATADLEQMSKLHDLLPVAQFKARMDCVRHLQVWLSRHLYDVFRGGGEVQRKRARNAIDMVEKFLDTDLLPTCRLQSVGVLFSQFLQKLDVNYILRLLTPSVTTLSLQQAFRDEEPFADNKGENFWTTLLMKSPHLQSLYLKVHQLDIHRGGFVQFLENAQHLRHLILEGFSDTEHFHDSLLRLVFRLPGLEVLKFGDEYYPPRVEGNSWSSTGFPHLTRLDLCDSFEDEVVANLLLRLPHLNKLHFSVADLSGLLPMLRTMRSCLELEYVRIGKLSSEITETPGDHMIVNDELVTLARSLPKIREFEIAAGYLVLPVASTLKQIMKSWPSLCKLKLSLPLINNWGPQIYWSTSALSFHDLMPALQHCPYMEELQLNCDVDFLTLLGLPDTATASSLRSLKVRNKDTAVIGPYKSMNAFDWARDMDRLLRMHMRNLTKLEVDHISNQNTRYNWRKDWKWELNRLLRQRSQEIGIDEEENEWNPTALLL